MTTALLVMDVQVGIVSRFGDDPGLLDRLEAAVSAARDHGLPVVFVRVAFRPGHPEIAPTNKTFGGIKGAGGFLHDAPETAIHPRVAPRDGEAVVTKKRVSGFAGSDLAEVLRGAGATSLVLTGIATSGVVLSTLRQAADLDFQLTVLDDACADADPEVHRVLTTKIFPRQAEVLTVDAWTRTL